MDFLILRLGVTLIVFLIICDPQCCWTNEEVTQSSTSKLMKEQNVTQSSPSKLMKEQEVTQSSAASELVKERPKNPRALYEVLKKKSEKNQWLTTFNLKVATEDLINPRNMNSSDVGPGIALYHYGYLSIIIAPKTPGGMYSLDFPELRSSQTPAKILLCRDLMISARENDVDVKNAFSIGNTTFERMPPESCAVKSFMLALDTIISSIPIRFTGWHQPAIFGALYMLGLNGLQFGSSPITNRILFGEDLSNNTRLLFAVDDKGGNATHSWDSYYRDLMLPILLKQSRKNLLMILVTAEYKQKNAIHDWYGIYRDTDDKVLQEYRPTKER